MMEKENTDNAKSTNKIVPMSNQMPYDPRRQPYYYPDDEISLVDLWIVLVKGKWLFFGILVVFFVAGLNAAILIPEKFSYKTSIEIGSRISNGTVQPIESPETLLAKIQESYIPLVQNNHWKKNPVGEKEFEIKARIPKGSQIIVLDSKGAEEAGEVYKELQRSVVQEVKNDHKRTLEIIRKDLEGLRNVAANKLDELKDAAVLLSSRESRVDSMKVLLSRQIDDAKKDLLVAKKNRNRAVKEASNATKAMTLLMLDNEIHAQRKRIGELEERMLVEMADSHDDFAKKIADNQRLQLNQQDAIANIESQLANLVETRALIPPMQSIKPTGFGGVSIIALAVMLGFIFAIFGVFIREFIKKANRQLENNKEQGVENASN